MSSDKKPVIYDPDAGLWNAVREGVVVSSDLTHSLRFKTEYTPNTSSHPSCLSFRPEPPEITVCASPPSLRQRVGRFQSVHTQTDTDDTEESIRSMLMQLLALYRLRYENKENRP